MGFGWLLEGVAGLYERLWGGMKSGIGYVGSCGWMGWAFRACRPVVIADMRWCGGVDYMHFVSDPFRVL